jgi:hypothetical protein
MGVLKSCAVFGALVLISCGSPAELGEGFPATLDETGYSATGSGSGGSTQSVVPVGSAGSGSAGSNSTGSAGSTGAPPGGGGCPSDITVLFARPIAQGGCTQGGGCHEAASPIKPDLVSPGLAARLLNVPSTCSRTLNGASVSLRPYIGANDSFLEEKLGSTKPACGELMPFFMDYTLTAADEQCILQWIDQVAAGGG